MVHDAFEGESFDDKTLPYHELCDKFESALRSGLDPQIEEYLKETRGANRSTALVQLVMIELQYLFDIGDSPDLEHYYKRFPGERDSLEDLLPYWEELRKAVEHATLETRLAPPARMLGRFELYAKVGSGGFGEVWRARDPRLKRTVAVKIINPETTSLTNLDLARHEASIAAQLIHPNIVSLHEFVEEPEGTYLVSEFVDGTDLRSFLKEGPLSQKLAVDICRQVARGLHHAHEQGIIHRDIKPANILMTAERVPKLTDFGIAHWHRADGTVSDSQKMVGTAVYMSPEQVFCVKTRPESDVYALGVVLFEMLTGEPPFTGAIARILHGHRSVPAQFEREDRKRIPRDLQTICLKALQKRHRDRYRSAAEFADDLDRFASKLPPQARRLNVLQRSWRRVVHKPAQAVLSLALMALFLSGLAFLNYEPPVDDGRREIHVTTSPPGAVLRVQRRDDKTFAPEHLVADRLDSTPGTLRLLPGHYRVSAVDVETNKMIEVNRYVPNRDNSIPMVGTHSLYWRKKEGNIHWPTIEIDTEGTPDSLVLIEGGTIEMVDPFNPAAGPQLLTVPSFYISSREFSVDDIVAIRPHFAAGGIDKLLGYRGSEPFRPKSMDLAEHWAEHYGCRLPTEIEYRYLMQQVKIPENWDRMHAVRHENEPWDYLPKYPSVQGIATGVAEWTSSYPLAFQQAKQPQLLRDPDDWRVAWGGNADAEDIHGEIVVGDPYRVIVKRFSQSRGMGFRLARSYRSVSEDLDD